MTEFDALGSEILAACQGASSLTGAMQHMLSYSHSMPVNKVI